MGKLIHTNHTDYVRKNNGELISLYKNKWYLLGDGLNEKGDTKYPYFIVTFNSVKSIKDSEIYVTCIFERNGTIYNEKDAIYTIYLEQDLLETIKYTEMCSILDIMLYNTD